MSKHRMTKKETEQLDFYNRLGKLILRRMPDDTEEEREARDAFKEQVETGEAVIENYGYQPPDQSLRAKNIAQREDK